MAAKKVSLVKSGGQLVAEVPWSEKYRPQSLDEVAAHKDIIDTIKKLLHENNLPHLLFYGPPGTGKTSTILAIARQIYGKSMGSMTLELNASDDRGISIVRNEIQDFASTRTIFSNKFKLIILDECDAMTKDAQFALRRVMEKYVSNARFCLICNYVSKIIPALQSRCTRFRFMPLPEQFVRRRLDHICLQEGIAAAEGGVDSLVRLGEGDMRRTLNLLQVREALPTSAYLPPSVHVFLSLSLPSSPFPPRPLTSPRPFTSPPSLHLPARVPAPFMSAGAIEEGAVYATAGKPLPADIQSCAEWLLNESLSTAYTRILDLQQQRGVALVDILQQLHPYVFRISMPPKVRIALLSKMAAIEHRLAFGTSDRLQLGAVCGAFAEAKEGIVAAAS